MNRVTNRTSMVGVLVVSFMLLLGGNNLRGAENQAEFFRGKNLRWILASEAGSPMDITARTIAPYLEKEIGARVRIENMHIDDGLNYAYNQGTRDGLTLVTHSNDAFTANELMKAPGVHYETAKFNFVADIYPSMKMFQISPKIPYKNLDTLRKAKGLKGGGTSAKGSIAIGAAVMFEILGLDGKVIPGYRGKKNLTLALGRGDVDIMVTMDTGAMRDEKDGYIVNLFALGERRSVAVPNAPALAELGIKVSKELETVYKFVKSGGVAVALPPGVPQERVDYLRKVFQGLSNNNDLQKARETLTGARVPFAPGIELQQQMAEIIADKDTAAKLDVIFKKFTAVR